MYSLHDPKPDYEHKQQMKLLEVAHIVMVQSKSDIEWSPNIARVVNADPKA